MAEARTIEPDLVKLFENSRPPTTGLPSSMRLRGANLVDDFSGPVGGRILVETAALGAGTDVEALLSWGADPDFLDPDRGTAMHEAVRGNNVDAVIALLMRGAAREPRDAHGRTPLEAAEYGRPGARAGMRQFLDNYVARQAAADRLRNQVFVPPIPVLPPTVLPGPAVPLKLGNRYRTVRPIARTRAARHVRSG